ncbi:hypothetical protein ABZ949_01855 [Micromonospora tulbaghiae]|uniref:hypothetical protein n=1 Tax=Micromonospora tulbaghiae TaxID=479978 RepID=UPI0033D91D9A
MPITSIRGRAAATLAALLTLTACGSPQPAAQPIATNIPTAVEASPTPEPAATTPAAEASPTVKPAVKPTPAKPRTTTPSRKPAPKATTTKPKPKPTTAKPPSGQQGVHPGAFCTPVGAIGYTSKGTKMRCTKKDGDIRARWRAA